MAEVSSDSTITTPRSSSSVLTRSTASTRSGRSSRSNAQVRSSLHAKLGIFNTTTETKAPNPADARKIKIIRAMGLGGVIPPKKPQTQSSSSQVDNENIRPKINASEKTQEPLKYRREEEDTTEKLKSTKKESKSSNGSKEEKEKAPRKKICFNDTVEVAHIPMRSEYSDRVRSRIWSNRYEIHENAQRNQIEFQAEGWDWRSTVEDEGMFVCTSSGELIHPIHCQQ